MLPKVFHVFGKESNIAWNASNGFSKQSQRQSLQKLQVSKACFYEIYCISTSKKCNT